MEKRCPMCHFFSGLKTIRRILPIWPLIASVPIHPIHPNHSIILFHISSNKSFPRIKIKFSLKIIQIKMSKFVIHFASILAIILGISLNLAAGQNNSTANGGEGGNATKAEDQQAISGGGVSFSDQPAPTPNEFDNLFNFKHMDPKKEGEELMRRKEEVLAKNLTNDKDFNAGKEEPKEMDKPPLVNPPSQNDKIIQIHVRFILRGKKVDVDPNDPSEERFLKTMYLIEVVYGSAGCKLLIFDTRTLCEDWPLGRMLMGGDGGNLLLVLGTKDGQNKWAASKKICAQQEIEEVYEEIAQMRARNGKMQKGLSRRETEIKNVLYEKFVDEELSKYSRQNWEQAAKKSTKGPKEPGFWEAMFG